MIAAVLGYPRSGTTLTQCCLNSMQPSIQTAKLHGHDIVRKGWTPGYLTHKYPYLILVIRNYRECVMSQLTRGDQQNDPARIKVAFIEYMIGISTYDKYKNKKTVIYYEDFITKPVEIVTQLGAFLNTKYSHMTEDIDAFMEFSSNNYKQRLGNPLTSGREVQHFTPITYSNYDFDWQKEIRHLNEDLYDKYLSRYGEVNE